MTDTTYDLTAIGNAIVDILAFVPDDFLHTHQMAKSAMQLVDAEAIAALQGELPDSRKCSGGSAANTVAELSQLGSRTCFLGRVANDPLGDIFTHDIRSVGVRFDVARATTGKPTAACVVCVTPDGERTMNTYIGACGEFTVDDLDEGAIRASRLLYVEGYLWDAEPAKAAIMHALDIARENGVKIAFSASDLFCVERHRDDFLRLLDNHVNVLFANEQEALALFPGLTLDECAARLGGMVEIAAITRGSQPAIIIKNEKIHHSQPKMVTHVVDATGAGDLFAAGFLHGWLQSDDVETCAEQGHILAGDIIAQLGARRTLSASVPPLRRNSSS